MFPMTVTIASRAELQAVMAALADTNAYAQAKAIHAEPKGIEIEPRAPEAKVEKAADAGKPAAAAPSAPASAPSAAAAPTVASPSEPKAEATYADAAAAITKVSRTKGRDAAVAVLKEFGAAKLPDVKPEQFADIIAAAEAALEA